MVSETDRTVLRAIQWQSKRNNSGPIREKHGVKSQYDWYTDASVNPHGSSSLFVSFVSLHGYIKVTCQWLFKLKSSTGSSPASLHSWVIQPILNMIQFPRLLLQVSAVAIIVVIWSTISPSLFVLWLLSFLVCLNNSSKPNIIVFLIALKSKSGLAESLFYLNPPVYLSFATQTASPTVAECQWCYLLLRRGEKWE